LESAAVARLKASPSAPPKTRVVPFSKTLVVAITMCGCARTARISALSSTTFVRSVNWTS